MGKRKDGMPGYELMQGDIAILRSLRAKASQRTKDLKSMSYYANPFLIKYVLKALRRGER